MLMRGQKPNPVFSAVKAKLVDEIHSLAGYAFPIERASR